MVEINGLYNSTVSGLAALPKQLFQTLVPPKAVITQYRLHVVSGAHTLDVFTNFYASRIYV